MLHQLPINEDAPAPGRAGSSALAEIAVGVEVAALGLHYVADLIAAGVLGADGAGPDGDSDAAGGDAVDADLLDQALLDLVCVQALVGVSIVRLRLQGVG